MGVGRLPFRVILINKSAFQHTHTHTRMHTHTHKLTHKLTQIQARTYGCMCTCVNLIPTPCVCNQAIRKHTPTRHAQLSARRCGMGSAPRLLGRRLGRDGASSVLDRPHLEVSARLTVGVLACAGGCADHCALCCFSLRTLSGAAACIASPLPKHSIRSGTHE